MDMELPHHSTEGLELPLAAGCCGRGCDGGDCGDCEEWRRCCYWNHNHTKQFLLFASEHKDFLMAGCHGCSCQPGQGAAEAGGHCHAPRNLQAQFRADRGGSEAVHC